MNHKKPFIFSYSLQGVIEWSTHSFISDFLWLSNCESTLPIEKNKVRFVVYKILGNVFIESEFCGFFGSFTSCLIANFGKISNRKNVTIISQLLLIPSAYSKGLPCFLVSSSDLQCLLSDEKFISL